MDNENASAEGYGGGGMGGGGGRSGARKPLKKTSNMVLYHFSHSLMNKDMLIQDPEQCFARILRLYYYAMNHEELYSCLKILYAQTGMTPTKSALCSVIKEMYSKPRTLKQVTRFIRPTKRNRNVESRFDFFPQLARVAIYNSIDRRPAITASKLPLPPSLREYVLNFEP